MLTFLIWALFSAVFAAVGAGLAGCRAPGKMAKLAAPVGVVGGIVGWALIPTMGFMFLAPWAFAIVAAFFGAWMGGAADTARGRQSGAINIAFSGIIILGALFFFTTHGMFHAEAYRRLLGNPLDAGAFQDDLAAIDTNRLRVVNREYAAAIADKMLGDQAGLGSETDVGELQISQLNGCFDALVVGAAAPSRVCFERELVWVAPLVHNGFFRWLSNHATHEYAIVSAVDPARKLLVRAVGGQDVMLRYHLHGAHFGDNLMRHVRENGYLTTGLTDVNFELDDEGRPWWVVVTFVKRIGFRGVDPNGVLLVDPASGAITRYSIADAPPWIDRMQPEAIVTNQFDNWGKYGLGWWNSWTAHTNVVQTSTFALHLVEGVDGRTYWYTGIASIGNDQSTTGFILVDTRTKATRLYHIPGAMEDAAQRSAENTPGARERQYIAGEPILYNVADTPTYFMTLSGEDHVPRMYAFVSVRDYQVVGASDTAAGALQRYQTALHTRSTAAFSQTVQVHQSVTGDVLRLAEDVEGRGRWLLIETPETTAEYFVANTLSPELKFAETGDRVRLTYEPGGPDEPAIVTAFDDLNITLDPVGRR